MKLKTSFFNKGIILSGIKRYSWIAAIWSVLLFLAVPVAIINAEPERLIQLKVQNYYNLFLTNFGGTFSNIMLCAFPVLTGVMVFSYLHSPKAAATLHGMPFSRPRLFASSLLSGAILMIIPFIITTVSVLIIKLSLPVGEYIPYETLFTWLLNSLCMALVIYSLAVFVGMFTGNIVAHIVFTYILHFLPFVLYVTIGEILHSLVYGYIAPSLPEFLTRFPMFAIDVNSMSCNAAYVTAAIVLLALAFAAYRKRPIENAGDIVTFRFLRPVFKYGVTFCTAIVGYTFFSSIMNNKPSIVIPVIFVIIGYAIAQMLISKTWRIWKSWKGLAASIVIVFAFVGIIKFDITGFEKYVPALDSVSSVEVKNLPGLGEYNVKIENSDDIAKVIELHKKLIENKPNEPDEFSSYSDITISYHTPGKDILRYYRYSDNYLKDTFIELYSSSAVRMSGFAILDSARTSAVKTVNIFSYENGVQSEYTISSKEQINALIDAYKSDILSISAEDLLKSDKSSITTRLEFETVGELDGSDNHYSYRPYTNTALGSDALYYIYDAYYINEFYPATTAYLENNIYNRE